MNVTKETVTPKKAMDWLKRNIANRPLTATTVNHYSKAITDGAWKLNGDCIRFNGNGDLIDGQHRLNACVKAGIPFESYVVRGLDHDAFDTIDQGKRRDISDVFARDGYKNYTTLASAVRWMVRYSGVTVRRVTLRPDQAHAILEDNPGLHHAVDLAVSLRRQQQKLIHPGLLAFLIHETSRELSAVSEEFWTSVISGANLTKGSAAHMLNKRLVANLGAVAKLSVDTVAALCIKAWNFHVIGKPCLVLKWSEGEEFPKITYKVKVKK